MGFIVSALKKIIDKGLEDNAPENCKEVVKKASAGDAGEHLKNYVTEKRKAKKEERLGERKINTNNFASLLGQNRNDITG